MMLRLFPVAILLSLSFSSFADNEVRRIPNEYESVGGEGLAFGNSGVAAVGGASAVRTNPAMLPLEKQYRISGSYDWPTGGRDFFKLGVVDTKTSSVAAGISYTGFMGDYVYKDEGGVKDDSPLIRRGILGIGQIYKVVSIGLGIQYIETNPVSSSDEYKSGQTRIKGTGLTLGLAGLLSEQLRFGLAVEGVSNKKIKDYAPRVIRAGFAYIFGGGNLTAHADYRQRDRVEHFERKTGPALGGASDDSGEDLMDSPEKMVIISGSAKIQNVLRILAGYGHSVSDDRRSLSGGLAIVNNNFVLSYLASRPYMNETQAQQGISLAFDMGM